MRFTTDWLRLLLLPPLVTHFTHTYSPHFTPLALYSDSHYGDPKDKKWNRHPLFGSFLCNLWEYKDRVVPCRMHTVEGTQKGKEEEDDD